MTKAAGGALAAALALAPCVAAADLRISEIMYDPAGADGKREWIEIFNDGSDAIDLSKFKFSDTSNHLLNAPPKNGGVGSMSLAPGERAVLAADAAAFLSEYPGAAHVIDTAMSLNNTGGTISLAGASGTSDTATYAKSLGASGSGETLQLSAGAWVHAAPTPGATNASQSSKKTAAKPAAAKTAAVPAKRSVEPVVQAMAENDPNDPLSVVNSQPSDEVAAQAAAAGMLGGSYWWLAAAALAILSGAAVSLIRHEQGSEWRIEEAE